MKAAVLGATGYTGMLLVRLLASHPEVRHIIPSSTSQAGTALTDADRGLSASIAAKTDLTAGRLIEPADVARLEPDVVFSALPHLTSAKTAKPFIGSSVVIDLSADFRLADARLFHRVYGEEHPLPELLGRAVYGLVEWQRTRIATADLIANPGCYPTAVLLPLLPLVTAGLVQGTLVVNALSGISGAGRAAKINSLFCERAENVNAYSPGTTHRHAAEISHILSGAAEGRAPELLFTPHLVPIKQGMAVTTVVRLKQETSADSVRALYSSAYSGSPCIGLTGASIPETRHVRGANRLDIGWHIEGRDLLLFSVMDNLVKGASGQAVQNMNVRFGFSETAGLAVNGEF